MSCKAQPARIHTSDTIAYGSCLRCVTRRSALPGKDGSFGTAVCTGALFESCRRLKIPVRDYLADILPGLANARLQRIADLTPAAWATKMPTMHLV